MGVLASITNWLRPRSSPTLEVRGDVPPGVMPPARTTNFTTDTALTLPAVYRAVSLLATGVAQLSVDVWRGDNQISPPLWIERPDIKITRFAFLEQTVTSLLTHGNAFWRVIRDDPASSPDALIVVNPWEVTIDENTGEFSYRGRKLQPWQMQHLAHLRIPGRRVGIGPIQAARNDLAGAVDLRDFAGNWFHTGTVPNGIISSDQMITDDDAAQVRAEFLATVNANEPTVLGQGFKYLPILLNPKDAQFLESRQFSSVEIARLFGIPSHLLLVGEAGGSQTYLNQQDADLQFSRHTLTKYVREIEEAFTALLPRTQVARFNMDAILRASTKARYEAHQIGLGAGFLTIDEVRKIEGLDPLDPVETIE